MALYTKVSNSADDRRVVQRLSQKATSMARQLPLSDEDFLIVLHNKLRLIEFEQPKIWPVIKKSAEAIASLFGLSTRQAEPTPQKIVFNGMEMQVLQKLTGFEAHEELHLQEDFEMEVPVLRQLLENAKI